MEGGGCFGYGEAGFYADTLVSDVSGGDGEGTNLGDWTKYILTFYDTKPTSRSRNARGQNECEAGSKLVAMLLNFGCSTTSSK